MTGLAGVWLDALGARFRASSDAIAVVMGNDPGSVALFFALSCLDAPLVLLPPDLVAARGLPPLPEGTRLVLAPSERHLEAQASGLGAAVTLLPDPPAPTRAATDLPFMTTPGVVLFTSGSTGRPRPVYRATDALIRVARALVAAVGLAPGRGVIGVLPLARAYGLNHGLMAAAVSESPLALLDGFDHNALLRLFASGGYDYWAGTPMMADVLSRCALAGEPVAPRWSLIGGRLSAEVARRFRERFGVPLRQIYGTTETGSIAVDGAPADAVRSETAGRLLPGVRVRIGDDPRNPAPPGTTGRIWVSTPDYMMDGYGVPPRLDPPDTVDSWWGTPDVGALDDDGRLTLVGRLDDCFRTAAGHLVSPSSVSEALDGYPSVRDTAVVPLDASSGPVLGVLVECADGVRAADVRGHLARSLPAWSQPRVVETTGALPRLDNGRIDRRACIAILEAALTGRR